MIRKVTTAADLEAPEHIRSTALRKHVATLSQLVDLTKVELEQLANFLGHDLNVHMDFYRLPDDILQINKIGNLLIAAKEGKFSRKTKMSLDSIKMTEEDVIGSNDAVDEATPDCHVPSGEEMDPKNLDGTFERMSDSTIKLHKAHLTDTGN